MTTKYVSGTLGGGYSLKAIYSAISITSTGVINGETVNNYGDYVGNSALTLGKAASVFNTGHVTGGYGKRGADFHPGYLGWDGLTLCAGGYVLNNADGVLAGGAGGIGGYGRGGGEGAVGVALGGAGYVINNAGGVITGGAGGDGGTYYPQGGIGGIGGDGLVATAALTLVNRGAIAGGGGGAGGEHSLLVGSQGFGGSGGDGVDLQGGGKVINLATIAGGGVGGGSSGGPSIGGDGVLLSKGSTLINGSSTVGTAEISGDVGVAAGAYVTVINYGTIAGNTSILFENFHDRLVAENHASFVGTMYAHSGTLELAGGSTTISNLGNGITLTGAVNGVASAASPFAYYDIDAGASLTINGGQNRDILTDAGSVIVNGTVGSGRMSVSSTGAIFVTGQLVTGPLDTLAVSGAATVSGTVVGVGGYPVGTAGLYLTGGSLNNVGLVAGSVAYAYLYNFYYGGTGVVSSGTVAVTNSGTIQGGAGGLGGTSTIGAGQYGGVGGAAISVSGLATVSNSGTIRGGAGGAGGVGTTGPGGQGGAGGAGVSVSGVATVSGKIQGGVGGAGGATTTGAGGKGGAGGAGLDLSGAATVTNSGTVLGGAGGHGGAGPTIGAAGYAGDGGDLYPTAGGSSLTNAAGGLISGRIGLYAGPSGAAKVTNFGTIQGTGGVALQFTNAGDRLVIEPGAKFIGSARGGGGTLELAAGKGTINLGSNFTGFGGCVVDSGGTWTFTGANNLDSGETLTNDGAITLANGGSLAVGGNVINPGSVTLASASSLTDLRVLASGATLSGGGVVKMSGTKARILGATAAATLTNADNTISGAGFLGANSLTLINQAKGVIDAVGAFGLTVGTKGLTLTNQGLMEATGGGTLAIVNTTVANAGGTIMATNVSPVKLQDAVVQGGGITATGTGVIKFNVSGGELDGAASTVSLSGVAFIVNGSNETLEGSIANAGKINLIASTSTCDLIIGAAGATLSGGGQVNMTNSLGNRIYGLASGDTLTNVDNRIDGAGVLGNGVMTLINDAKGQIVGNQNLALTIDTGTNTIVNAGLIENVGKGGTQVKSAVANTGTLLAATAGTLTLAGAVTGAGLGQISGGTLYVQQAFAENVTFTGSTGTLELGDSQAFTGKVVGLSTSGTNALDLVDIGFFAAKTKATYSGTTASGTLTVTDGTHTANIALMGNYLASTWTLSGDGHGGTKVVDPSGAAPLAQAMAGFGQGRPARLDGAPLREVNGTPLLMLSAR